MTIPNAQKPMLKQPLVSIGMPVFNGEKYIRDALESLIQQSFSNFELIISDNASTDHTAAICQEYADRDNRITYIRQSSNIGAAANFQFVLDQAKAEIFMWAAHDDLWAVDYLERAMPLLDDASVAFVFPTFCVASIRLGIKKKFDERIFRFVESRNKETRVLGFVALHHNSHKCNLVYSLFRKNMLQAAIKIQHIGNDGVLATVILSLGRCRLLSGWLFTKRYPTFWPGLLSPINRLIRQNKSKSFDAAKNAALDRLCAIFPKEAGVIANIFDCYQPYSYGDAYQIYLLDHLSREDAK